MMEAGMQRSVGGERGIMHGMNPVASEWLRNCRCPSIRSVSSRGLRSTGTSTVRARLKAIVGANAGTAFGQAHDFAGIRTPEDFADRVPVGDHATNVQPWLERMRFAE